MNISLLTNKSLGCLAASALAREVPRAASSPAALPRGLRVIRVWHIS